MTIQDANPAEPRRSHAAGLVQMLSALSAHARGMKGWERRGVRGWAFTDELGRLPFAGELLATAAERGFIHREDVLDPGRTLPFYINRITQAGEDHLALHETREPDPIPSPRRRLTSADEKTLYLPASAWEGLHALATVPDPEEWVGVSRLGPRFYAEHRKFLESRKLIEVLRPASGRSREGLRYRATSLGRGARARDTTTSEDRVQIRVRGLALRAGGGTPVGSPSAPPGAAS